MCLETALMRLQVTLLAMLALVAVASASDETWDLAVSDVPFDYTSPSTDMDYKPLSRASRHWNLCVSYPHLKDAYWLGVNYGMVLEARRLGIGFRLVEAGGYPNLARQADQIKECVARGADALVVGSVSYGGLTPIIRDVARRIPVIAAVNDIADDGITAKAAVSWHEMGAAAGRFIAQRHPKGSPRVKVARFTGPPEAGWVRFVEQGFREALEESSADVVVTRSGDTGREIQVPLVEDVLDRYPDIDYLAGNGPMTEAAVSILRARGLTGRIGIVSDYMTHAVYRGIKRGRILAAPTDFPELQGRLAIEQAVRALEGKLEVRHAGPRIVTITSENIEEIGTAGTLAPAAFVPVFEVE
jgi:protein TorT